ncbi:MAG TPA: hypothetical protein VMH61_07650 [Candidatus Acidoferrales bacterium]|nr:hypothetical protein [Candidatus Acidoferrales bacterium]
MIRTSPARRWAGLATCALVALAALSGCAKKMTQVDAGYTQVEGVPNRNARIVTWVNQPIDSLVYLTVTDSVTKFTTNVFQGYSSTMTGPPGIEAEIFDSTNASSYQVFRRTSNGGYAQLFDFPLVPELRWADTEWEMYGFSDQPSSFDPFLAYVGRGVVNGNAGPASPLTNVGVAPDPAIPQTLQFTASRIQPDSIFTLSWTLDPNAAGYWIECMPQAQLPSRGVTSPEASVGLPVLAQAGSFANVREFMGVDGSVTVLTRTVFRMNQLYVVRVNAVDAQGRIINRLRGDYQVVKPNPGGVFELVPAGGVIILAGLPVPGIPYGFNNNDFETWNSVPHPNAPAVSPDGAAAVRFVGSTMQLRVPVR